MLAGKQPYGFVSSQQLLCSWSRLGLPVLPSGRIPAPSQGCPRSLNPAQGLPSASPRFCTFLLQLCRAFAPGRAAGRFQRSVSLSCSMGSEPAVTSCCFAVLITRGSCWWLSTKIKRSIAARILLFTFTLVCCLEMKII